MARPPLSLFAALALSAGPVACDRPSTPPPPETPQVAAPPPDVRFDPAELRQRATDEALVPSPAETQRALTNAGIGTSLVGLLGDRPIRVDVADKDEVAVRTGVVLARLVLSARDGSKEQIVGYIGQVKAGLSLLGAPEKVLATLDDLSARVANEATARDELVRELDDLAGLLIPEVEYAVGDRALPLLRAGAWLEGAWLVTGALQAEKRYDAADQLLRQPAVVAYFQGWLKNEGAQVAPAEVISDLNRALDTVQRATGGASIGEAEVAAIHDAVGSVLTRIQD